MCLSNIEPEEVRWLWNGWIPEGKLTLLFGDPGVGKSFVAVDIAARVSAGRACPGDDPPVQPGNVVLLSREDDLAATLVPRLQRAKADLQRIFAYKPEDMPGLEEPDDIIDLIKERRAKLLVLDTLMAFLHAKSRSNHDQEVRAALQPINLAAQETGCAVLIIHHANKGTIGQNVSAIHRAAGSVGIVGLCRSVLYVGKSPTDPETSRVLASAKNNLGPSPTSLAFRLPDTTGSLVWEGRIEVSADDLATAPVPSGTGGKKNEAASNLLIQLLANGPQPEKFVEATAKQQGISPSTLKNARSKLKVKSTRQGDKWILSLPLEEDKSQLHLSPYPLVSLPS